MTIFYGVQAAKGNLPGQNSVMPTEFGGQVRLAHDYFTIGSGETASTITPDDVVSLNSILIPTGARVIGGFMTCEELSAASPADARIELGTAADMATATAVIDLRYGDTALLDVILNDNGLNSNYHMMTVFDPVNGDAYVDTIPEPFYAWIRPDATSQDWNQAAATVAVGIYYIID